MTHNVDMCPRFLFYSKKTGTICIFLKINFLHFIKQKREQISTFLATVSATGANFNSTHMYQVCTF